MGGGSHHVIACKLKRPQGENISLPFWRVPQMQTITLLVHKSSSYWALQWHHLAFPQGSRKVEGFGSGNKVGGLIQKCIWKEKRVLSSHEKKPHPARLTSRPNLGVSSVIYLITLPEEAGFPFFLPGDLKRWYSEGKCIFNGLCPLKNKNLDSDFYFYAYLRACNLTNNKPARAVCRMPSTL